MSFPRYESYKNSGVEWLGDVPSHWGISRLGFEAWVRARLGWRGLKAEEYVDDGYALLATPNIKGSVIDFGNVNFIDHFRYEESPEIKLRVGDILLAKDGSTLGAVNVVRALPIPATVNSSIAVISTNTNLNSIYGYYLFQSYYIENTVQRIKGGMGVPHLFQNDLNRFYIPLPSLTEQSAIATFLDREAAKIDALIDEQKKLIELLKEKRQAVISHAVTKGLDPKVPMKDSGVEWLGEVPTHWELKHLKWAVTFQRGHDLPSEKREEGTVPVVSSAGISGMHSTPAAMGPGIVTGRYGTIGTFYLMTGPYWPLNTTLYSIDLRGSDPNFLIYLLLHLSPLFLMNAVKSAVPGVDRNDIHPLLVAIPLPSEQVQIAHFLHLKTKKMDALLAESQAAIAFLQERRSSLISAAVTGKIDVRDRAQQQIAAE